jgi:hypothetical protein
MAHLVGMSDKRATEEACYTGVAVRIERAKINRIDRSAGQHTQRNQ